MHSWTGKVQKVHSEKQNRHVVCLYAHGEVRIVVLKETKEKAMNIGIPFHKQWRRCASASASPGSCRRSDRICAPRSPCSSTLRTAGLVRISAAK